jgi:ferritin-like metal-binding protein YciE
MKNAPDNTSPPQQPDPAAPSVHFNIAHVEHLTTSTDQGFRKLFLDQVKDMYWAELTLTTFFPNMIDKASSQDLKDALASLLSVTEQQVSRCEEILAVLHERAEANPCEAMQGLLEEAKEITEATQNQPEQDAAIISATQKIVHYEIASYATLATWSRQLQEPEIAGMLEETLQEEKECNDQLGELAATIIDSSVRSGTLNIA